MIGHDYQFAYIKVIIKNYIIMLGARDYILQVDTTDNSVNILHYRWYINYIYMYNINRYSHQIL